MQCSIWISSQRSWAEIRQRARWAEERGWFGFWTADHLMPNDPAGSTPRPERTQECWTILAAVAAITSQVRLGSLVSPVTLHHPVVLAKRVATVDDVSAGRAVLGLGAGWQVNEHLAAGVELVAPAERVRRFEEAIEIIHRMWGSEPVTTSGTFFRATDLPVIPADQRPTAERRVPLMVGTAGPRMSRIAARWASEWNTWGDVPTWTARAAVFHAACERVGRDPHTVWHSAQASWLFADDPTTAERLRRGAQPDRAVVGSSAHLLDVVGQFRDLGLDELVFPDMTLGATESERAESYDRLWTEVISKL